MIQKLIAYAVTAAALVVLLSSTARISVAILSQKSSPAVGFDVHLDEEEEFDLDEEPILPIHRRLVAVKKGESGPGAVRDVLPSLAQLSSRARRLDVDKLPYGCGAILYDHHIPGEGGDALDKWIRELTESNDSASFISSRDEESKESFLSKVEKQITKIGRKDWKIIYSHANGLSLDADEQVLQSWRETVEERNCHFVAATVFSEPLDHSIKHTKKQYAECNCSMEEFQEKIMETVEENPWTGQLDHLLFNSGDAPSMETKDKVKRGMQLLKENFDLVLVDGQGDLSKEILRITGWTSRRRVKKASVSDGGLVYSKNLVGKYGKMSTANGDADFIDAVMHVYHNSLQYLMMQ